MPNHIQNRLKFTCSPERLEEVLEAIKYEDDGENRDVGRGTIDFNKLIPMPKELNIEDGSKTNDGISLYLTKINPYAKHYGSPDDKVTEEDIYSIYGKVKFKAHRGDSIPNLTQEEIAKMTQYTSEKKLLALGQRAVNNAIKYGATTWYDWCVNNWGTKWNSYSNEYDDAGELLFWTAWAPPRPVIVKLSEMFPDVVIHHQWADEDIGYHCGEATFAEGEMVDSYEPEDGKASVDFAMSVWGYDAEFLGLMLNATETDYINIQCDEYELVEFQDKTMLFANERLGLKDIPKGMYKYDIRGDDQGEFAAVEPHVAVNHEGTLVSKESIDFGGTKMIELNQENAFNFPGGTATFEEYMKTDYSQTEGGGMKIEQ